jgi:hypothetical protein
MKGDLLKHSIYRIFLACCAALFFFYLTSCASHQKYPSEWPALISVDANTCPDISGTYVIEDEGVVLRYKSEDDANRKAFTVLRTDNALSHLYLYEVFPMKYFISRGRINDATHAQISQPDDDTLEIAFLNNQGLIDKKIYSRKKKEYACSPKGINFLFSHGGGVFLSSGYLGAGSGGKYYLAKSIDGSLIIKEEGTALGVFIIIPFGESYDIWNRFKVYKK